MMLMATTASAQENLQRGAIASQVKKTFTTVKELPITSVKNQYRSGTCWAYATLGYFESEILRQTGRTTPLTMCVCMATARFQRVDRAMMCWK